MSRVGFGAAGGRCKDVVKKAITIRQPCNITSDVTVIKTRERVKGSPRADM
jgi:hypothetical protein